MKQIHSSSQGNSGKNGLGNKRNCFIDCRRTITLWNHGMSNKNKQKILWTLTIREERGLKSETKANF